MTGASQVGVGWTTTLLRRWMAVDRRRLQLCRRPPRAFEGDSELALVDWVLHINIPQTKGGARNRDACRQQWIAGEVIMRESSADPRAGTSSS